MDDIRPLFERDDMSDEEMVAYLAHCMIDAKHPRVSIETLLHAFLPFKHVDHTHPDAIISICCADNGRQIAEEIFGDRFVWVPYIRPGFKLSKMIAEGVLRQPEGRARPDGEARPCHVGRYGGGVLRARRSRIINEAEAYIEARVERSERCSAGTKHAPLPAGGAPQVSPRK